MRKEIKNERVHRAGKREGDWVAGHRTSERMEERQDRGRVQGGDSEPKGEMHFQTQFVPTTEKNDFLSGKCL